MSSSAAPTFCEAAAITCKTNKKKKAFIMHTCYSLQRWYYTDCVGGTEEVVGGVVGGEGGGIGAGERFVVRVMYLSCNETVRLRGTNSNEGSARLSWRPPPNRGPKSPPMRLVAAAESAERSVERSEEANDSGMRGLSMSDGCERSTEGAPPVRAMCSTEALAASAAMETFGKGSESERGTVMRGVLGEYTERMNDTFNGRETSTGQSTMRGGGRGGGHRTFIRMEFHKSVRRDE